MKTAISVALLLILAIALASCSGKREEVPVEELVADELTGEITVSCFDADLYANFLNEAAALFESAHPDTKINIEVFSKMPEIEHLELEEGSTVLVSDFNKDEQEAMSYILRINTRLMSDTGPDILAMDALPYYKYAASGMLEDLQSYMDADPDFDKSDYRYNIFESVRYKGGQYIIPLNFAYDFIIFGSNNVGSEAAAKLRDKGQFTYAELIGLIEEKFAADDRDTRVFDFIEGAYQAFRMIFKIEYNKYVDIENKKSNFTDGSFVKLLNDLNEQQLNGYFGFFSNTKSLSEFPYYYQMQVDYSLKTIFMPEEGRPSYMTQLIPDINEIAGLWANGAGQVAFRIYQAYGMNAHSHNKALSWAFIKFMLSEEMQQAYNLIGCPVNNAAFIEDSKEDLLKLVNFVSLDSGGWTVNGYEERTEEIYVRAYEEFMEYHNRFANALNYYPLTDRIITLMVYNEAKLFFDGAKSAEMVADTLQNKIWLYLNE